MLIDDAENELTPAAREAFWCLCEEALALNERVNRAKKQIKRIGEQTECCQQFITVPGVGPMVATALFATMGDPNNYRNG